MISKQQIKTKESLQVKSHHYLGKYRHTLTLPEYKNMHDMCLGILKSKSVIANRIGQSLQEKICLKKTCDRLYRNLRREDIAEILQRCIIKVQSCEIDSETVIIVDDSDIIKAKAKKMEGLKKVRDGSTGAVDKNGYDLINLIACKPEDQGYQIMPLSSDIVSRKIEPDSVSQLTQDRIVEVIINSGNRGVYIFDRGYDNRFMFGFCKEHGCNYIVRSKADRGLIVNGVEESFETVAKSVQRNTKVIAQGSDASFNCGIKRVKIRLDGYPRKYPKTTDAWLVVARYEPNRKGKAGFFYFLCDFPTQNLTTVQIIQKVIHMYHLRWKIEEVHRHIKQVYGWEKMQLMSYTGLKNMNQFLLLAMCYLYSLKSYTLQLVCSFPQIMTYSKRLWKQVYYFVYYRISNVVAHCFTHVTRYNILEYGGVWANSQQLIIPCLKNGGM